MGALGCAGTYKFAVVCVALAVDGDPRSDVDRFQCRILPMAIGRGNTGGVSPIPIWFTYCPSLEW